MARKEIDRWTLGYWFLRSWWAGVNFWIYYRRIGIYNRKNMPLKTPLIIAPNHQNALMDAMAYVVQPRVQRVFLTRADVFNKPFIERILYYFKMLPIYRIRDGRETLKKNEEIFEIATKVVRNGKCPLFMFPEGNHGDKRRLRPLVKGVFRIAFKAQEAFGNKPGVKILPTGLEYESYQKFGKSLTCIYGEPIEVSEYWDEFEKNPATATNLLRDRLSAEMRKVMIDIQTEDYYDTYEELRVIARPTILKRLSLKDNLLNRFKADKHLIEKLDNTLESSENTIQELQKKTNQYIQLKRKLNFREWLFYKKKRSLLFTLLRLIGNLIFSPVLLLGLICNAPVFFIPIPFGKKIKDTQFRSTAKWGMGIVLEFIYYPILIVLGFLFLPNIWLKVLFIPVIPFSMKAAYTVWRSFRKNIARISYILKSGSNTFKSAQKIRTEILSEIEKIIE